MMFQRAFRAALSLALLLNLTFISGVVAKAIQPNPAYGRWVDTWVSMPQLTEPANLPPPPFNTTGLVFQNSTIRQTLHMSIGSKQIRIRISNAFGTTELPITAATVALPLNGTAGISAIQPQTLKTLTFSGNKFITIPNGAQAVSDPIDFPIKPNSILTVSLYTQQGQTTNFVTSHPGSRTTSFFSFGDSVSAANLTDASTQSVAHWYFVSAVEAWSQPQARGLAIVGDSITDGRGSTTNGNDRWTDFLISRLLGSPSTSSIAVLNQAAGGNRVLADGLGPSALSRFDRDVLAQSGIGYALLFEGVNDIGTAATDPATQKAVGDRLLAAYDQLIARAHAQRLPIFGATITPFSAPNSTIQPYSDPEREKTRARVNDWIRTSKRFDGVVDFDRAVADKSDPTRLDPRYNTGDYLHLNPTGYKAMADAFPIELFERFRGGVNGFV